jgi:hypothetical protein
MPTTGRGEEDPYHLAGWRYRAKRKNLIAGGRLLRKTLDNNLSETASLTWKDWFFPAVTPPASIVAFRGLHHIMQGIGDSGVGAIPQTLHTIDEGI